MLMTDMILLLAMATSPTPAASSLHPVAAETKLAQAAGWRRQSAASAAASRRARTAAPRVGVG